MAAWWVLFVGLGLLWSCPAPVTALDASNQYMTAITTPLGGNSMIAPFAIRRDGSITETLEGLPEASLEVEDANPLTGWPRESWIVRPTRTRRYLDTMRMVKHDPVGPCAVIWTVGVPKDSLVDGLEQAALDDIVRAAVVARDAAAARATTGPAFKAVTGNMCGEVAVNFMLAIDKLIWLRMGEVRQQSLAERYQTIILNAPHSAFAKDLPERWNGLLVEPSLELRNVLALIASPYRRVVALDVENVVCRSTWESIFAVLEDENFVAMQASTPNSGSCNRADLPVPPVLLSYRASGKRYIDEHEISPTLMAIDLGVLQTRRLLVAVLEAWVALVEFQEHPDLDQTRYGCVHNVQLAFRQAMYLLQQHISIQTFLSTKQSEWQCRTLHIGPFCTFFQTPHRISPPMSALSICGPHQPRDVPEKHAVSEDQAWTTLDLGSPWPN